MRPERWHKIEQLCNAALEYQGEQRAAYLKEACAADDSLRQEVESLLEQASSIDQFLELPVPKLITMMQAKNPFQLSLAGQQLGSYKILSLVGSGGMGEVYRAHDTKLKRDVAIKVLPSAFVKDSDRLARFQREARMLAALNHPNIAHIYALEESNVTAYLVMELVSGETLAERITREGAVPIEEALKIAVQIAEALEAAHEKGIIHRDLKPGNVKVTPEGKAKVLDFGLAKAFAGESGADLSNAPTLTPMRTEEGRILGTPAYMSPEQARGQLVDKRTDIWAFGCLFYELLTGKRAFRGETTQDTIAAILERETELQALPAATPAQIRNLLRRCLKKDKTLRLQAVGDARVEIQETLTAPAKETEIAEVSQSIAGWRRFALLGLACMVVVTAGVAIGRWLWRPTQAPARNVSFQQITDFAGIEESPAISPDGKTVAFVASTGGWRQIWIRLLAGGTTLQVTQDNSDHEEPRWVPDSSSLIYYSPSSSPGEPGTIWEISALGGAPHRIASTLGGVDISHNGHRIAAFQSQGGRMELIVFARDGSGKVYLKQALDENSYDHPRWSPDDRWIAFHRDQSYLFDEAILVVPAAGGEQRTIVGPSHGLRGISWLPDSSGLVYGSASESTILYPPVYNLKTIRLSGGDERQLTFGDVSYVEPDVHPSGKVLASRIRMQSDIWRFSITGSPEENTRSGVRITRQTAQVQTPSLSPDGSQLVYLSDSGGHGNLWVAKTDGSGVRQITFERDPTVVLGVPVWSPAGNEIVFIKTQAGKTGEWLVRPDGSELRQFVPLGSGAYWSSDGRWLYYSAFREGEFCIDKVPLAGGPALRARCGNASMAVGVPSDSSFYYLLQLKGANGGWDFEVRKARPENGPSQLLARVPGSRIPVDPILIQPILSPNEKWLAVSLIDGATNNLWAIPAEGGPMRRLTDFGSRTVLIVRRISWSPDSKHIYAAIADTDADVVLFDGLLPSQD